MPCAPSHSTLLPWARASFTAYSPSTISYSFRYSIAFIHRSSSWASCSESGVAPSAARRVKWRLRAVVYFSLKFSVMSPRRMPLREVLSVYVGPIPFPVVPILAAPLACSLAASSRRWVGRIRWALRESFRECLRSMPPWHNASASSMNSTGSSTTPLPMRFIFSFWNTPEGIERSTYFLPSNSRVCPALGPPWNRATTS